MAPILRPRHVIGCLAAASVLLVALDVPAGTRLGTAAASLTSGVAAFTLMAAAAVLGARWKWMESWFGGLDRVYIAHKWLGIWALGLASFHLAFKAGMPGWETTATLVLPAGGARFVRQFSYIGLMFIVLLALNRNVAYGTWRWWHKLSGPLFLVVAVHWLSIKSPIAPGSPAWLWLASWSVLGAAGASCKLLLYPWLSNHAEYRVEAVDFGPAAMRLQLEPMGKVLDFQPGQFGFLRMNEQGLREPHPFTIASANGGDGRAEFVIRSLGDFTGKLIDNIRVGMLADIYAPFGRFARRPQAPREVWIGAGVGISPFIAWLKDRGAGGFDKVTLFYFYTPGRDFPDIAAMQSMASECGATLVPIAGGVGDPVFAERFAQICRESDPSTLDVAFCGPKGLMPLLRRQMQANGVPNANLRHEYYEFR